MPDGTGGVRRAGSYPEGLLLYPVGDVVSAYADAESNRILRVNMPNIRGKIEQDSMALQYTSPKSA